MLSQPWGNSAAQLAARTEQGLGASERQSVPARLPDEDGEQGDRDTSAQATHERSECQFWKPPVPSNWRPLYVDAGLESVYRGLVKEECLPTQKVARGLPHPDTMAQSKRAPATLWGGLMVPLHNPHLPCSLTLKGKGRRNVRPETEREAPAPAAPAWVCLPKQLPPPPRIIVCSHPDLPFHLRRKWRPTLPTPPPILEASGTNPTRVPNLGNLSCSASSPH